MTAIRLAEYVAKTTDVDGMLNSMTSQQFDEWCAKDLIEPIGTPYGLADLIAKIGVMIAAMGGHEVTESNFAAWYPAKTQTQELTRKESAVVLTAHLQGLAREVN